MTVKPALTVVAFVWIYGVLGWGLPTLNAQDDAFRILSVSQSRTGIQYSGIDEINLAEGVPVESDSVVVVGDRSYATDGDYGTLWYSYQGVNSSIRFVVDLGERVPIGRVVARANQTATYLIETSDDRTLWTERHAGGAPTKNRTARPS